MRKQKLPHLDRQLGRANQHATRRAEEARSDLDQLAAAFDRFRAERGRLVRLGLHAEARSLTIAMMNGLDKAAGLAREVTQRNAQHRAADRADIVRRIVSFSTTNADARAPAREDTQCSAQPPSYGG